MRHTSVIVFMAVALAASAPGQQPAAPQPQAQKVGMLQPTPTEPLDIWQIDINPSGTGFALTTPVLEGDVYVFKVWPDRAVVHLPKSRVKKMVRRTKDINDEVVYRIDLVPSGQMIARDNPTLKGTTYTFHAFKLGTFMSVRQSDVKAVTRVQGLEAFKLHLQELGAQAIGNLPMQGGGTVTVLEPAAPAPGAPPSPSQSQTPSNWIYQGVPGVTDAWAPPSAVINSPGDVPRAAEPRPHI